MNKICGNPKCKKSFYVRPSQYDRRTHCSRECMALGYRKVERPSKKVLGEQIHSFTWKELSEEYGVSMSAVRKWAKRYGLKKIHTVIR